MRCTCGHCIFVGETPEQRQARMQRETEEIIRKTEEAMKNPEFQRNMREAVKDLIERTKQQEGE